ncbi:Ribosomal RNA large subunit methyltransferase J [uncultured Gammaproteobacteria bacterium]
MAPGQWLLVDRHEGALEPTLTQARAAIVTDRFLGYGFRAVTAVFPLAPPEQKIMNYRHIYHAGNFADVFKHAILVGLLTHLRAKPTPFRVFDTHAGIGGYDLTSAAAEKTGEAAAGIGRLLALTTPPPELAAYLDLVRDYAAGSAGAARAAGTGATLYPGSPALAQALLRPDDRLVLAELHPDDAATLKAAFARDRRVTVHHMDGYQALKSLLPPHERRGLVLIDPPFEVTDEFDRLAKGLATAWKRWPTGIYALWYPIKERPSVWRFHEAIAKSGFTKALVAELTIHPEDDWRRLNGCGMVILNPPWQAEIWLAALGHALHRALAPAGGGSVVQWLIEDK